MSKSLIKTVGAASVALMTLTGAAGAAEFGWSVTAGGTSDYVFRGISFTNEDPAAQGSIDVTYGIAYAGLWGSNISGISGPLEIDYYAGVKPVLGPVTFDFGVIYYTYPDGDDELNATTPPGHELDYVELKAGASGSPVKNLTVGVIGYWSPDQQGYGDTYAIEGSAGYTLPAVGIFTPTIGGVYGWQGTDEVGVLVAGDDYTYWNIGLALAVEKFTFDFRYWDTDIDAAESTVFLPGDVDERFVFSAKVTLP